MNFASHPPILSHRRDPGSYGEAFLYQAGNFRLLKRDEKTSELAE